MRSAAETQRAVGIAHLGALLEVLALVELLLA
jgi:hypothetical protein